MGSTEAKAAPQEGRLTDHVWPRGGRPGHEQLGVQTLGDKSARRSRKYKELLQQETPHSPSQRPDISPKTTDGHTHVERCSDPRSRGKRESEPPRDPAPPGPAHTEECAERAAARTRAGRVCAAAGEEGKGQPLWTTTRASQQRRAGFPAIRRPHFWARKPSLRETPRSSRIQANGEAPTGRGWDWQPGVGPRDAGGRSPGPCAPRGPARTARSGRASHTQTDTG